MESSPCAQPLALGMDIVDIIRASIFTTDIPHRTIPQAATPETAYVGHIDLGDSVGGEALFIPSNPDDDVLGGEGEEDDGFLVAFVTPKDGGNSGTYRKGRACGVAKISGFTSLEGAQSPHANGPRRWGLC